jgi:hypothetical protein
LREQGAVLLLGGLKVRDPGLEVHHGRRHVLLAGRLYHNVTVQLVKAGQRVVEPIGGDA